MEKAKELYGAKGVSGVAPDDISRIWHYLTPLYNHQLEAKGIQVSAPEVNSFSNLPEKDNVATTGVPTPGSGKGLGSGNTPVQRTIAFNPMLGGASCFRMRTGVNAFGPRAMMGRTPISSMRMLVGW